MRGGAETENLLGGVGVAAALSSSANSGGTKRGKLTVHRGQLYYGDVAGSPGSQVTLPPPSSSSSRSKGRCYQGGVSFPSGNTLVDIIESSSSDEYDEREPYGGGGNYGVGESFSASSALGFDNGVLKGGLGKGGDGVRMRGTGGGLWSAALGVVACALLVVFGVAAGNMVERTQPWWQAADTAVENAGGLEGGRVSFAGDADTLSTAVAAAGAAVGTQDHSALVPTAATEAATVLGAVAEATDGHVERNNTGSGHAKDGHDAYKGIFSFREWELNSKATVAVPIASPGPVDRT
jgi:hypothetical protein